VSKCKAVLDVASFDNFISSFLLSLYGAPFLKILYLTDLAQKLLSLAEIAISACRDVICGRDSYICMQRCYLGKR